MRLHTKRHSSRGFTLASGCLVLLAAVFILLGAPGLASHAHAIVGTVEYEWVVTNLTNTPYVDEELPDICGDKIVWNTWDDGHNDVYVHDLYTGVTTNLTNTPGVDEWGASVSDNYAMWNAQGGWTGADIEMDGIGLSDGFAYYTNNSLDEEWPSLAGDWGVWQFFTGGYGQIIALNYPSGTYLRWEDSTNDYLPRTDGDQVVWYGWDGENWEIFYVHFSWADPTPSQLTHCAGNDRWPDIDGDHIVFVHQPRNDTNTGDIVFYDMDPAPGEDNLLAITDDYAFDGMPRVSGELVTWERDVPGGVEVRVWDRQTGQTVVLSQGVAYAMEPNIDGYSVVWEGANSGSGQTDIYLAQYLPVLTQHFPDVDLTHPYFEAIKGMYGLGIIGGYTNGNFGPYDSVRRAQFAKMIVGTMDIPPNPTTSTRFTDIGAPDAYGYPHIYVQAAYDNGITYGTNQAQTLFAPWNFIRRDQVVSMIVRAATNLAPGALETPPAWFQGLFSGVGEPHGNNLRIAEWNGLLDGLVGLGPGWSISATATRGEVAEMLWNLLLLLGG